MFNKSRSKSDSPAPPWYVSLLGLAALLGGIFADAEHQITKNRLGAFTTYYQAAAELREGKSPYGAHVGIYSYVYPPFYAFVMEPLSRLPVATAARIVLAVNATMIAASLLLLAGVLLVRLGLAATCSNVLFVALGAGFIVAIPMHNELRGLETNALMLLSFTLALCLLDRWPALAGLALAASIDVKYLPVVVIPYLLLRRRWIAAGATVIWAIALALLPAISLGWSTNLEYLRGAQRGLAGLGGAKNAVGSARVHDMADASSLSITSALARVGSGSGSKALGMLLVLAVIATCGLIVVIFYRRRKFSLVLWPAAAGQVQRPYAGLLAIEWVGIVTAALVFSPNTQNRNLVLAAFVAALAVIVIRFGGRRRSHPLYVILSVAMFVVLLLPIASMGHGLGDLWIGAGATCWFLLAAYVVFLWGALRLVQSPEDAGPQAGRRPPA